MNWSPLHGSKHVLFFKEDIKSGEKELAQLEDKERQLNQKIKTLTSKLRAEQDEVKVLVKCILPHLMPIAPAGKEAEG